MNTTHHASASPDEAFRAQVLAQLEAAGAAGVSQSKLIGTTKASMKQQRLRQLVDMSVAGEVQMVQKGKVTRCWLPGQMPVEVTPEEKADEVLRRVLPEQRRGRVFTLAKIRTVLLKGTGIKEPAIKTCVRVLEQQRLLVRLTEGARVLYTYAPALRTLLDEETGETPAEATATTTPTAVQSTASTEPPKSITHQMVIDTYRAVRARRRLPDVEIASLQAALGCTAEEIKRPVQQLCEQGIFIPGKGDWSFASTAARAAAVLIQKEPYLFVRMKE